MRRPALVVLAALLVPLAGCGGDDKDEPDATPTPARCPLTGTEAPGGAVPERPALVVKIDNVDAARPQAGLDRADLVVEETVEGGLTRLFAVFHCAAAPSVGPIRSARTTDVGLLQLFDGAIFAYSGANKTVNKQLAKAGAALLAYDSGPTVFRLSDQAAPHNVYASTRQLVRAGVGKADTLAAPGTLFTYSDSPPADADEASTVKFAWSGQASASWSWSSGRWERSQNGTPDVLADDKRVGAENVVAMRITTRDTGLRDVAGNASPEDVVTGSGKVWVLRDGKVLRGTWTREQLEDPLVFTDPAGHPIPLAPGVTWIELLPPDATLKVR
jgi:hypothetical protein